MRKLLLPILLFAAFPLLRAQCPNLDFSNGDFTNWKCYISNSGYSNGKTCYDSLKWTLCQQAVDGRHTIMSDIYDVDWATCNGDTARNEHLPLVPDGFRYSARIGNNGTGSNAESIRYPLRVDSSNYWVAVHYAAVLEFSNHVDDREARFGVRFQDTAGNLLPVGNVDLSIKDTASMIYCYRVYWKDWDVLGVNLSPWIGQTVEIVIYAADCGHNGHCGYGYAACECGSLKGNVRYCRNSNTAELSAPWGYRSYRWTDSTGRLVDSVRQLKVVNPQEGALYHCRMSNGKTVCDSISLRVMRTLISPSMAWQRDSLCHWVQLKNSSRITGSVPAGQAWEIGKVGGKTEFVGRDSLFEYLFKDTGLYEIRLTAYAASGCSDTCSLRLQVTRHTMDVELLDFSYPGKDTLLGHTALYPEVRIANHGNLAVYDAVLTVWLYDSLFRPLDSLTERVRQIPAGDTIKYAFADSVWLPNYTGRYSLGVEIVLSSFENDTVIGNNRLQQTFRMRHRDSLDVQLVAVVKPTVDGLPGSMLVMPVVRLYNHSNIPANGIRFQAFLTDSAGRVLDSLAGSVASLKPEEKTDYRFAAGYRVPNYNGVYYLKIFLTAHPSDMDLSNDTIVRMAFCLHIDTVDVAVLDIVKPADTDTLDKNERIRLKVRLSNTGNKSLEGLRLHALVLDKKRVVADTLEGMIARFGHGDTVEYLFPSGFILPDYSGRIFIKVYTDAVRADLFRKNDTLEKPFTIYSRKDTADMQLLSLLDPKLADTLLLGGTAVRPSVRLAYRGNKTLDHVTLYMKVCDSLWRVLDSAVTSLKMPINDGDTFRMYFNRDYQVPNYTGKYVLKFFVEADIAECFPQNDTLSVWCRCLHNDSVDLFVADILYPRNDTLKGGTSVCPKVRLCCRSNVAPKDVSLQLLVVRPNGMADTLFEKVGALRPRDTVDYLFVNPYRVPNINGSYCLKIRPISVEKDYNPGNDEFICWFNAYRFDTVDVVPVSFVLADTLLAASTVRPVLQMVNRSTADVSGFSFWADAADSAGNLLCAWNEGNLSIMAGDTLSVRLGKAFRLPNFTGKIRMRAAVSQYPKSYALLECDTLVQFFQCVHSDTVDVALASLLYPVTTEVLQGHTEVFPQVRVVNRGNVAVRNIALAALVYGQDGVLADSVPGFIPLMDSGADTLYVFPTPYLVPNVAGSYSLTVRMTAPDGDVSEKDNELQRKLMSKKNLTVDLQMLKVTLSDTGVLAGGTWVFPHVRVANPLRNTVASGVFVYAELLDSSGMQLALLHGSIDRIGMADTAGLWFADSFCVPDYTGVFMVRAFVEGYGHEADYSNDTLQCVFSCQKSDAVTSFFRENWQLGQNTPNPAVERTLVPITLPEAGMVRLQLYSVTGMLLYRQECELYAGENLIPLELGGYAAGVYFYSVEYKGERKVIKMNVKL